MKRFVVLSFVFLGFAFYVLSGGSEYEPVPNSLQAQAKLPPEDRIGYRAPAEPDAQPESARTLAEVEAVIDGLSETEANTEELSLTLATARSDATGLLEAEANRPKAELLTMDLPEETFEIEIRTEPDETEEAIDAAVAAALGEITFDDSQIRWVKETIIDLRTGPGLSFDRVTQVTKGTEVAILEDPGHGWLNVQLVDGFQTGWVAEWLLMKPEQ